MIKLTDINKTYPGAVPLHVLKGINLHDRQQLHGRKVIAFLAEAMPRFDLTGAISVDRG